MRRVRFASLAAFAALTVIAAACGGDGGGGGGGGGGGDGDDNGGQAAGLLGQIQETGTLKVSTNPAYPPQSKLNEKTQEWEGFDIDVANEIGERLGVQVEFVTPQWESIIAGNWNGRWDVSVGSMTVTPERAEVLHFVEPYYYTPASVAVLGSDTETQDIEADLDGKTIGVCGGCTYDLYLQGTLDIPGEQIDFVIDDPDIRTYDTVTTALSDLEAGRVDAVISSITTLQGAADAGQDIRILEPPVFYEPLSVAVDKKAEEDPMPLVDEIDRIVQEMHEDGTLSELSEKWFGQDLTKKAE